MSGLSNSRPPSPELTLNQASRITVLMSKKAREQASFQQQTRVFNFPPCPPCCLGKKKQSKGKPSFHWSQFTFVAR